jgi:type II secretory pathway pseudopilin PulG
MPSARIDISPRTTPTRPAPTREGCRACARRAGRASVGFTLVEVLVVLAVIMILIALGLSVVKMVRTSSYRAETANLVQAIDAASRAYLLDRQCLVPVAAGDLLITRLGVGGADQNLDLLAAAGFDWRPSQLSQASAGQPRHLIDAWKRPISYTADRIVGGVAVTGRPAAGVDWNPDDRLPFPYIWSLGPPSGNGDAYDAEPAKNLRSWIYNRSR